MIAPALAQYVVPIGSISPWPGNPRRGRVDRLMDSLKRFGQLKPVLVQHSSGHIIARHNVYRAAQALGWTEIAAVLLDVDDLTAKRYLIADNRTSDLGDYDDEMLAVALEATVEFEGTGWAAEEVADFLASLESVEARAERGHVPDEAMRSVIITMGQAAWRAFITRLDTLQDRYQTNSGSETVYEAVRRESL